MCTKNKEKILSSIVGDGFPVPKLTAYGSIVKEYINETENKYKSVRIDKYIIMPNHIHLLIRISKTDGTGNPSPTLSKIMGWFKYQTTRSINSARHNQIGTAVWQRSYYDHIIRNQHDYNEVWEYIDNNCLKWNGET